MSYLIEDIYKTEGVPEFTFVKPPNYNQILVDIRHRSKPVIIEGQSGTGKTTVAKKILQEAFSHRSFEYLSARRAHDIAKITDLIDNEKDGLYVIDDFHRLDNAQQEKIANLIKLAAEDDGTGNYPKIVIIGINKVGSELIYLVHDIAKRCGIHKVLPATQQGIQDLIAKGEDKLNISIGHYEDILEESSGDYWLAQLLCQSICMINDVLETSLIKRELKFDHETLRSRLVLRLENTYLDPVKEFCRGRRFRASNDPYFKLLKAISSQESSIIDLNELANSSPNVKGSINNIKEHRINVLLESKPICERYFYYNNETKNFAIEDPALFYYIKHLDWDRLRKECGFRESPDDYEFDIAISFAGENRELAKTITDLLQLLDCRVFYDEYFEANYLGQTWSKQFEEIFGQKSRLVVCLLDQHYKEKIWPTFERECFSPRISDASVIPIYLDNTKFVGIPQDIVGIKFTDNQYYSDREFITDHIAYKLEEKLQKI